MLIWVVDRLQVLRLGKFRLLNHGLIGGDVLHVADDVLAVQPDLDETPNHGSQRPYWRLQRK